MARLVEGVAEVCVTVAVVAVEDEPMAMIELDSAVQPHRVATGACDHDADKAHDRWDCPTCQARDLWVTIDTLLHGTDAIMALNVLADLHTQLLQGLAITTAEVGTPEQRRSLAVGILAMMQEMAARCIGPLEDALVEAQVLEAPGSGRVN